MKTKTSLALSLLFAVISAYATTDITDVVGTLADIADQFYSGAEICPAVSITDGEKMLELGVDYTVECTNNISIGTAGMIIIGMGDYAGTISKNFKIVQAEISNSYKTTNLDTLDSSYVAQNGEVLMGSTNYQISIANGATVMLNGVNINNANGAGITCLGNCNIVLIEESVNIVKSSRSDSPGIRVGRQADDLLTISGTGSLEAHGYEFGAGIGSERLDNGGAIVISGGIITATGGASEAAGVGCGLGGRIESITISGGTITATGGRPGGAGIGDAGGGGGIGSITISGGAITAMGGGLSAGIGGGLGGEIGNITIDGGTITATGGYEAAGIGGGFRGETGNITISGKTRVKTTKGRDAPYSIGQGAEGSRDSVITIGGIETQDIETSPFVWISLTHTDIAISSIPDQTYTGSAICPAVSITDGETPLELNVDYTVKCSKNISAGTAEMTITGMGDYGNSIRTTFEILKANPTMVKAPVAVENLVYNGKAQTLVVAGEAQNGVMVYKLKGADKYSKTLPTATKAGDYTVYFMVRGNDNYNDLKAQKLTVSIEASSSSSVKIASSSSKEQGDGFASVAASGLKVQFVRNELTVTATTASGVKAYVFDLQGNLKKQYHGQSAGTHSVSLGQLNRGLYLVRVVSSGNVQTLCAQVK